jgi:hypothetical protein
MLNYARGVQERIDSQTTSDELGANLDRCLNCGAVDLAERIDGGHDCNAFRARRNRGW